MPKPPLDTAKVDAVLAAAAVFGADVDGALTAMSSDAKTCTVEITGDAEGTIARRLPRWITVKRETSSPVAR